MEVLSFQDELLKEDFGPVYGIPEEDNLPAEGLEEDILLEKAILPDSEDETLPG